MTTVDASGAASLLSEYSTALLTKELSRRQDGYTRPECGSNPATRHSYNTSLHVFALFLILVLSVLACSFPIIVRRFPSLPVPHRFLFLSRHFGTGVLIATAFVHLLPTAFVSLTDPCLPPFWNETYPAMAGFIAMLSVLVVVGIEMFFATRGAGHVHGDEYGNLDQEVNGLLQSPGAIDGYNVPTSEPVRGVRHFRQGSIGEHVRLHAADSASHPTAQPLTNGKEPDSYGPVDEEEDDGSDIGLDDLDDAGTIARRDQRPGQHRANSSGSTGSIGPSGLIRRSNSFTRPQPKAKQGPGQRSVPAAPTDPHEEQRLLLQCLLLEAGILFHSVFIGMALSVATGTPFIVLLVAISFHQTFEGLALGSRIAAITTIFGPGSVKPWLMALAYGTTTPIGQAIGLIIHRLYDPFSETGLLMVGIMNAISSGLLLFAGLVELLAEDFLADKSYETLVGKKRLEACGAVVAGSMLMALVGAFA